jgi:hypothetical protein
MTRRLFGFCAIRRPVPFALFPNRDKSETRRSQSTFIIFPAMTVQRHLILQELTLRPSGEWTPQHRGWMVARVAEGVGYWQHDGKVRELHVGDGFVLGSNVSALLRSSQLELLKLQFFTVQPQYLAGLLSVAEWHQLEFTHDNLLPHVSVFTAGEIIGQKFSRLAAQTHSDALSMRCALLQLWVGAITDLLGEPAASPDDGNKLRERFRQLVGQMPEAELAECSLSDLAAQLHCSERHFSRMFREEFGLPFQRVHRNSNSRIINATAPAPENGGAVANENLTLQSKT